MQSRVAIMVCIGLTAAGCSSSSSDGQTVPPPTQPLTGSTTSTTLNDETCRFAEVPSSGWVTDRSDETNWLIGDPEMHNIDVKSLDESFAGLTDREGLFSFLVARNGTLVVERYFNGANAAQSREVASASKSVMSVIVGLAIDRGHIDGVDETLASLLPEAFEDGAHQDKADLTLKSLLTMSGGFAYEPTISQRSSSGSTISVEAILSTPRSVGPPVFDYNTGGVHIASAIVTEATGMSTCRFANEALFDPIGIDVDWWNQDKDGVFTGGWNLYLTPRELARFGQVVLDEGVHGAEQVVSEEWIQESTKSRMYEVSGPTTHYGYWWWNSDVVGRPMHSARGGGEQMVYIIPHLDMVVVTTSETDLPPGQDRFDSLTFLWEHLIPAIAE